MSYTKYSTLTKSEFAEMQEKFDRDQIRWSSLTSGQTVYDSQGQGLDIDYFEMTIKSVDVDNRQAVVVDHSQNGLVRTVRHFSTIEELEKQGIKFK